MRTNKNIKKRLINKALQSYCKFRVAALGFNRDGQCVASATNRSRFSHKGGGIHAEERLFFIARRKGIVKILICRIGSGGNLLPIDPCSRCSKIAEKLNIKIETIKKD